MNSNIPLQLNSAEHYYSLLDAELTSPLQREILNTDKVLANLRQEFEMILTQAGIDISDIHTGYLIGSYSRGTAIQPYSDIDVLTFSGQTEHFETMLEWRQQLLTFYMYTLGELEQGLTGQDSLMWIQSLKDALPIYGEQKDLKEVDDLVMKSSQASREKQDSGLLPSAQVRRLIEYRRKAYAQVFTIASGAREQDDISVMQFADASRKFIENYLLLKYFMSGNFIESESNFFELVRALPVDSRSAVTVCMSSIDTKNILHCMDVLLADIKASLLKPHIII